MSSLLYKKHSIIYRAALEEFTGKYVPTGQIVWHTVKRKHGAHSFTLSEGFATAAEAQGRIEGGYRVGGSARPAPACLIMQLREYPLIRFRDLRNWPPVWLRLGRLNAKAAKTVTGEIGILKEVRCHEDRPGRIYLTVAYNGAAYVGCLLFDDQRSCKRAFEYLRHCYGMSIEAIGSSELP